MKEKITENRAVIVVLSAYLAGFLADKIIWLAILFAILAVIASQPYEE